jgi:ATP-dependent protease HslVU (ClpYQ) peptidase subunit
VTTIAWRAGVLAADTATSSANAIIRQDFRKIEAHHGCLAAACGTATYAAAFLRWFLNDEKGEPPVADSKEGDRGLIVRKNGALEIYETGGWFPSAPTYYAMGSGNEVALGAMCAGADAEKAVRCAIEHNPHTGGDVTVLRLETMP